MATKPKREKKTVASAPSKSNDERFGDDQVLMDQFHRELTALLRLVKEKQIANLGDDPVGDSATMRGPRVAHYGVLGQKILLVVRKLLLRTDELALAKKRALLLEFGDKFAAIAKDERMDKKLIESAAVTSPDRLRIAIDWIDRATSGGNPTQVTEVIQYAIDQLERQTLQHSLLASDFCLKVSAAIIWAMYSMN
ncbi:hypothetical protein PINS_up006313 [Pythium insidiosum]|nr:hypothetical protein PINS_up006313 [Pythium insidiosum]